MNFAEAFLGAVIAIAIGCTFSYRVHLDDKAAQRAYELKMKQIAICPDIKEPTVLSTPPQPRERGTISFSLSSK